MAQDDASKELNPKLQKSSFSGPLFITYVHYYALLSFKTIKLILEKGKVGETYCVGSKDVLSNLDLVNTICDIYDRLQKTVKSRSLIEFVKDRAGHDKKYAINFSKLKTQLGWKPTVLLDKGLEETIQWYIDKNKK